MYTILFKPHEQDSRKILGRDIPATLSCLNHVNTGDNAGLQDDHVWMFFICGLHVWRPSYTSDLVSTCDILPSNLVGTCDVLHMWPARVTSFICGLHVWHPSNLVCTFGILHMLLLLIWFGDTFIQSHFTKYNTNSTCVNHVIIWYSHTSLVKRVGTMIRSAGSTMTPRRHRNSWVALSPLNNHNRLTYLYDFIYLFLFYSLRWIATIETVIIVLSLHFKHRELSLPDLQMQVLPPRHDRGLVLIRTPGMSQHGSQSVRNLQTGSRRQQVGPIQCIHLPYFVCC